MKRKMFVLLTLSVTLFVLLLLPVETPAVDEDYWGTTYWFPEGGFCICPEAGGTSCYCGPEIYQPR